MDSLSRFLREHGVTLAELSATIARHLELQPGEWLFAAGSWVEGLANPLSDLDVYLVSPQPRRLETRSPSQALDMGGLLVDIEVLGSGELEALAERFERWASGPRSLPSCFALAERERLTLHRLATAVLLAGDPDALQRLRQRITVRDLARHKLDWALAWITTLQVDLEGLRRAGDWQSMLPVAGDVLGHTVDALLAAHLETNPTAKWRFPLLRKLPPDWERELPGRRAGRSALDVAMGALCAPAVPTPATVYERARSILAFSRRVVPWAEATLVDGERPPGAMPLAGAGGPALGELGMAVQLRYRAGRFVVADVSRVGLRLDVSRELGALLCLFDGVTTEAEVEASMDPAAIEEVRALVRFGGFTAAPLIDTARIEALIAAPGEAP